jgi:hypothetical protein
MFISSRKFLEGLKDALHKFILLHSTGKMSNTINMYKNSLLLVQKRCKPRPKFLMKILLSARHRPNSPKGEIVKHCWTFESNMESNGQFHQMAFWFWFCGWVANLGVETITESTTQVSVNLEQPEESSKDQTNEVESSANLAPTNPKQPE